MDLKTEAFGALSAATEQLHWVHLSPSGRNMSLSAKF
jgi:hypothetical protein